MADQILSAITPKTTPVGADILYIVDSQNVTQNAAGSSASLTIGNLTTNYLSSATQTLTNKTFDTAGTGNVLKISGTAISAVTGTGNVVLATSPTLTTPTLGVATATTINKVTITTPASSATLTIANGKILTANNSITLAGTDSTTMTFPSTSATIARTDAANTFTGVQTMTNAALTTPTITTPTIQTWDGWVSSTDTWTYVSASSFKITGVDRTATFTKGTRLKLTQTTVKYFVVTSSSFSSDTTINVAVDTDYTLANAAITLPFYSYQSIPQGYPDFFNFTIGSITWDGTPPNTASSTLARFSVTGHLCTVQINIIYTNAGTTNTQFTCAAPIAALNGITSKFLYAFVGSITPNAAVGAPISYQGFGGLFGTSTLYMNIISSNSANSVSLFAQYEI